MLLLLQEPLVILCVKTYSFHEILTLSAINQILFFTVSRDAYSQWRKVVWSPDCAFVVLAYGNGVVSFFDLSGSNLFNIPIVSTT